MSNGEGMSVYSEELNNSSCCQGANYKRVGRYRRGNRVKVAFRNEGTVEED